MMRPWILAFVLGAFGTTAGCYSVKYRFPTREYDAPGERHSLIVSNLFWGAMTPVSIDADAYCEHGVRKMKSNVDVFGLLAQAVTLGFWTPMKVKIECSAGPMLPGMPLDAAAVPAVVYPPQGAVPSMETPQ